MTALIPKYYQGATGSSNRPINLKLSDTVSIKDFGAIGDGTTDDSTAIQAAIATGLNVLIPNGTYLVGTPINLTTANQTITFQGQIIRATTTASTYVFNASSINGITLINPNFAVQSTQTQVQNGGFVEFNTCHFCKILNGTFNAQNGSLQATLFSLLHTPNCNDLLIQGNTFSWSYGNACGANDGVGNGVNGKRIRIIGNTFYENVDTSVGCWTNCSDVVISNNTFDRSSNVPSYQGVMIDVAGATDVVISNNSIFGNNFGIRCALNGYGNNNIIIANNSIKNQYTGSSDIGVGIRLLYDANINTEQSIKLVGNTITSSSGNACLDIVSSQPNTLPFYLEFDKNTLVTVSGSYGIRTQGSGGAGNVQFTSGNNYIRGAGSTFTSVQEVYSVMGVNISGGSVYSLQNITLSGSSPVKIASMVLDAGIYVLTGFFQSFTGTGNSEIQIFDSTNTQVGTQLNLWNNSLAYTVLKPYPIIYIPSSNYYYINWNPLTPSQNISLTSFNVVKVF